MTEGAIRDTLGLQSQDRNSATWHDGGAVGIRERVNHIIDILVARLAFAAAGPSRSGWLGRVPCAALLAVSCAAAVAAQQHEDGATAPPGAWYTAGGNAARTAATWTRPVRRAVVPAWTFAVEGEVEGEPRVWRDVVLVCEKRGDDERWLHVVDLASGSARGAARRFKSAVPLEPSLWSRHVAVRADATTLRVFELRGRTLEYLEQRRGEVPVSAPLLFARELYYRAGDVLVRHDLFRGAPNWTSAGGVIGQPSLRGDVVYAIARTPTGGELRALRRGDGEVLGAFDVGAQPVAFGDARIAVGASEVIVRYDGRALGEFKLGGSAPNGTVLTGRVERGGPEALAPTGAVDLLCPVAIAGDRWLGLIRQGLFDRAWVHEQDQGMLVLANNALHAKFADVAVAPSLAGGVLHLGASAVDLESYRILWRAPPSAAIAAVHAVVPADGAVLVVHDSRSLTALSPPRGERAVFRPWLDASLDPGVLEGATLTTASGEVLTGRVSVDAAAGACTVGDAAMPLVELAWLVDREGVPRAAGRHADVAQALTEVGAVAARAEAVALLTDAVAARDPDLLAEALSTARRAGAAEAALKGTERQLDAQRRRSSRPNQAKVDRTRERMRGLDAIALAAMWQQVEKLPAAAPLAVRDAALRAVLAQDPQHAGAVGVVRALAPEAAREVARFDARDWLDFLAAQAAVGVRVLGAPPPANDATEGGGAARDAGATDAGEADAGATGGGATDTGNADAGSPDAAELRELERLRRVWRPDLIAVKSPRLFVVSPITAPGSLARCVSLGELLCDHLDAMFAHGRRERDGSRPLKILLYESQDEYRRLPDREADSPASAGAHVAWSAGHYSRAGSVSRMYLPPGDDEFERVTGVFAHELTHHWVDERCPLFSARARETSNPAAPGYWIVEGFACLLERATFDLDARTVEMRNPADDHLDLLARSSREQRIPWPTLFRLNTALVQTRLDPEPGSLGQVESGFFLGKARALSQVAMFYAQSQAVCAYLWHADDGARRTALLDYLARYYTARGADAELDVERSFGASPDELGARVLEWIAGVLERGEW